MADIIKTQRAEKGDLVVGHRVYAFWPGLPAIPGEIAEVSESGARVVFDVGPVCAALGLPRRTTWTWRRSASAYQPKTDKTKRGVGLALVRGRAHSPAAKPVTP